MAHISQAQWAGRQLAKSWALCIGLHQSHMRNFKAQAGSSNKEEPILLTQMHHLLHHLHSRVFSPSHYSRESSISPIKEQCKNYPQNDDLMSNEKGKRTFKYGSHARRTKRSKRKNQKLVVYLKI